MEGMKLSSLTIISLIRPAMRHCRHHRYYASNGRYIRRRTLYLRLQFYHQDALDRLCQSTHRAPGSVGALLPAGTPHNFPRYRGQNLSPITSPPIGKKCLQQLGRSHLVHAAVNFWAMMAAGLREYSRAVFYASALGVEGAKIESADAGKGDSLGAHWAGLKRDV